MVSQISPNLDIFSWSPPRLIVRSQKISQRTCVPPFFDRHFSEKIMLRYVKRLPTLVHDFTDFVDKSIASGVQLPSNPYSVRDFSRVLDDIGTRVVDEKEVACFYERTTATFCLGLASSIVLGVPKLLRWNQSGNVSGYAIADGFLYFPEPTDLTDLYAQLEVGMGKETVKQIRLMAEKRSSVATYEFTNLAAGREDVMLSVLNLSNLPKFDWTICEAPDCATATKHEQQRTEQNMGPDAKSPVWTLDCHPKVAHLQSSSGKRKRDDNDRIDQNGVNTCVVPERLTRRSSRLVRKGVIPFMPPPPLHVGGVQVGKEKGKKDGSDNENGDEEEEGCDDDSYIDKHELSALHIVQQAWAQAVKADTSIIVVQSGNHEFIGIRHRLSQTLYISDIIQPHACKMPSYGKIHVGIYVAAAVDAIDRAKQRAAGSWDSLDRGGPSGGPSDRGDHKAEKKPRDGGNEKSGDMAVHELTAKRTLELASHRNVVLLYLQYGIYDSLSPSTFIRASPDGDPVPRPSPQIVKNYRLEECLSIVLKSEIGHGTTGEVLRGTLSVEVSACILLDIVVKLALGSERVDALRNEYKIYCLMRKSRVTGGITNPLGLFEDVEGGASALVMPYVGSLLAARPEFVLTPSNQEAILATLKEIHRADVLHGDLCLHNILGADAGLTIIDFGRSQVCCDPDAKNREYSDLQSLLVQHSKQSSVKNRMEKD